MVHVAEGNEHYLYYGYSIVFLYLLFCLYMVIYRYVKNI